MSTVLKDLRERRGRAVTEMRSILDTAANDNRELSAEEQAHYDKLFGEQEGIGNHVAREERQLELDRQMAQAVATQDNQKAANDNDPEFANENRANPRSTPEYRAAFASYLRNGVSHLASGAMRALQAGSDPSGGYLVAPQQFVVELIKAVDDQVSIRKYARIFQVPQAGSLGAPSLESDPADADWTTELATGSEDTSMAFGKRQLFPSPLAKRIKISQLLLRQALIGPEGLVLDRLGYKFGVSLEKAYLTGSGVNQPLGLFVASTSGISTARDSSTGNATTSVSFDGLIEAKYTLKSQYWPTSRWIFHRDLMKKITSLKDGEGQYLYRQSVRDGEPDTLLGLPMTISEFAPNTFTTGKYVGILGDFRYYWIADALSMQVQRLNELYAETNQVGFIGRLETDGAPVLEEAFVRVKLA